MRSSGEMGDVGWSAVLHELHEGLISRHRKTLGGSGQPLGKYSAPLNCSSQLKVPAVSSPGKTLGLRQAAPSEMEAKRWLCHGWTLGGHLVNIFRALSFFSSLFPHQLSSPGPVLGLSAGHRLSWAQCWGHGLTCAVPRGPAPGPGAPAAKGQAFSLYSQQLLSRSATACLPPLLSSVPQGSGTKSP